MHSSRIKLSPTHLANVGVNRFRSASRVVRSRVTVFNRGTRIRGLSLRGIVAGRGVRGTTRGALRWVRRAGLSVRNQRSFARRDKFMNRGGVMAPRINNVDSGTAGFSGGNQQ